jgi:F-type H+-transporting ATPase subunit epsilon
VPLRLQIVTPQQPVVDAEVDSVRVPGREGEFGVLEGHEPFLAAIAPGVVRYRSGNAEESIAVSGGFAEVTQDHVTLLARTAEPAADIDRARAEAARTRAQEELRGSDSSSEEAAMLEASVARASARLRALG